MHFLPVQGYEGLYEVSSTGVVRSVDRVVTGRDGINYPRRGQLIQSSPNKSVEYLQVSLWKNNKGISHYVHRLVAQAHIPNPEGLLEVNHIDGCRTNNNVTNLEWVTRQGNAQHAVNTGLRTFNYRLSRDEFIDCLYSVIAGESYLALSQRIPYKVPFLSVKLRKLAKELGIEHDLDESLRVQRITRARINGAKNSNTNFND